MRCLFWSVLSFLFLIGCKQESRVKIDHKLSPIQSSGAKPPQFEVEDPLINEDPSQEGSFQEGSFQEGSFQEGSFQEGSSQGAEKKCVETLDTICGPFSDELRKMCEEKKGGKACLKDEWNKKFYNYVKISLEENKIPSSSSSQESSLISSSAAVSKDLVGLKVAIDVGHGSFAEDGGGWEPGAVNPWNKEITEHRENWRQAKKCAQILENRGAKVSVFSYEYGTAKYTLSEKGKKASGHHIFVSMHKNATESHSTQGTETLYDTSGTAEDKKLASLVQKEMMKYLWNNNDSYDRGARPQGLGVLKGVPLTVKAAILTEAYFIDVKLTEDQAADMSEASGVAVAEGIAKYWLQSK